LTFTASDEAAEVAQDILRQAPADQCPHLAETEMVIEHAIKPDYGYAQEFGLDLILNCLERFQRNGRN
jgi:hypothetical protein